MEEEKGRERKIWTERREERKKRRETGENN